jgi:hypothetical protein
MTSEHEQLSIHLTNYLEKKVGMDVCSSNIRVVLPNMISLARA